MRNVHPERPLRALAAALVFLATAALAGTLFPNPSSAGSYPSSALTEAPVEAPLPHQQGQQQVPLTPGDQRATMIKHLASIDKRLESVEKLLQEQKEAAERNFEDKP